MDAGDHGLGVLELGVLGGHEAQDDLLARRHAGQGSEAAGALVVELQEEGVHVLAGQKGVGHAVVAALAGPGAVEVAAAHVRVDGEVGRCGVEHAVVDVEQQRLDARKARLVAAEEHLGLRVHEAAPRAVVELQVAAACGKDLLDEGAVSGHDGVLKLGVAGVDLGGGLAVHGHDELLDELGGRGDGELGDGVLVLLGGHEAEVLHEGVLAHERDGAREVGVVDLGGLVVEGQAQVGGAVADARKAPHEVEVPGGAAELAVGDGGQSGGLLLGDEVEDALILHLLERGGVDAAGLEGAAGLLQALGAQEAADDVEAVRGLLVIGDGHGDVLSGDGGVTGRKYAGAPCNLEIQKEGALR